MSSTVLEFVLFFFCRKRSLLFEARIIFFFYFLGAVYTWEKLRLTDAQRIRTNSIISCSNNSFYILYVTIFQNQKIHNNHRSFLSSTFLRYIYFDTSLSNTHPALLRFQSLTFISYKYNIIIMICYIISHHSLDHFLILLNVLLVLIQYQDSYQLIVLPH